TFSVKDIGDDTGYAYIYNYIVDTTPPVILKVFNGYYDGKGHISTHATIETLFANWTYEEDNESGIAYFEYSVGTAKYPNSGWNNTKGWTRVNATNNSVSVALDLTHMWVYYFNVRAINNASLVSDVVSSSGVLYQDVTAPACPGWSASTGGGCIHDDGVWTRFDASLHAYWNFTDNGSTIVMYEYAIGTRAFDGSMINYSNIAGPNQTSNSDVTVYGLELEYNKTYYWNVRAKNENGKWSQWYYSDNITVDNVKPYNGSISYPAINTTINVTTVTINTGTDDLSQVGTVVLQKSRAVVTEGVCGGFANYETVNISLGQGQYSVGVNLDTGYCHKFRLVVYDYAGNSETYYYSGGESFYVDTTPPEGFAVSLNNGAFWTTQQQLVINWSPAYDPESGIDYYAYYVNDSLGRTIWQWTNTTGTYASLTNLSMQHLETSIAYVRAYNPVGLSVMNFSNAVLYKDTVPPNPVAVISVETDTNSSDGWLDTVNNGNTNITALADEPELTCYLTEGDMDYSSAEAYGTRCNTSSYNINCNISLSEGTYTYHITCRDQHEGEQSASQNTQVSFIVDWSAPNITITNPSPGEIMGEIINFEIDISDERGVDSAWYYIMNTSWNTTGDLTSPWDFTWDSSTVSDGNYTLLVYANDTGGLTGNASVNFTVDNTIPAIDIFYPDPDNKFFNSDFNLNLSVRNTFVNTSYSITNASGALMQNNTNTSNVSRTSHDWTDNVNISGWPDGNYTLLLYAVDIVGNDLSKTFVFYTDQTAPQYSKIARTPDPVYNDMDVQLNTTWPNPFNTIANQYDLSLVIFSHNASGTWTNITTPIDPDNVFTATISSSLLNNSETVYWYSYARDFVGNSNQTPMQTFTVQNRVPVFNGTIPDQSWPEDTDNTNINLSSYYSDQDNDDLSYSYLLMPRGTLLYDMLENETDVNAIGGSISNAGFVGGKYADGILMEATSTNLIINPSFEDNSSGLDNWTAVNSPKYNTTNASNTSFGVASVRVNLNNHYEQVVEVDANAVYTLSEYLKSETGTMTGRLHIHWLNSSRAFISTNICATGNCSSKPTINTSYVRYQTTETAPANAAYARIIIDNSNASYVWVDAVQFEKKPYATSFVTGARAEGTLMYNTTIAARDNFNPAAGTVEMWVKPEWDGNDTGTHWFFREYNDTGNYFLFGKRQSAQLVFEINSSITIGNSTYSNYSYTTADISSWVKDEWHFIAATWNNSIGNMSIYIDGKLKNTSTGIVTPTSLAMYMYAGYQADSVIDEFAVFDYAKTPGEIARDNTTQITQGLNISVSISSGIVTLTPVDYWFGEHRINFFGSDGHSKTGSNNVNLEVTEDNPRFLNAINDSDTFQRYHNFTANITIRDDHGLSVYIFSTNVNGSWVNETVSISGRERNASESRNITVSQGNLVCWYYWANDSAGYSNKSTTHCFTVVNTVPTIAAIILNATTEGNWTYDNLTLHIINTTDVDNDEVKNIINWYVDNASITLLNMPFEGGSLSGNSSGVPNATKDYSSYANNVTIVNATWDAAGGYDGKGAYSFDGDDYINVTSLSTLGITQVMWVKNSSDTAWHHVANVSGTQYIDGVVATGRLIPISNSAGTVIIGMNYSGTIDDVMIFNRSLSAAQIKALYENRTDLTVSDETVKNETWYAAVTPNDGTADGATYYSNNLTISNINTPPYFTHSLTTQTAYVGVNFTYDINASDKDPGETVTYSINTTKLSINDTTGLINWTAPTTTESLDVNVTICDDSGASNNCTSDTFTINVYTLSTIENSTINGTFYSSNVTADIPGIVGSTINLSTISGPTIDITDSNIYNSTIINSTILRCNITDSTLNNMDCVDTVIDPSNLKESNTTRSDITGSHVWYSNITDSNITDSTIDYSDITDSNITDSTITNSTIENSKIINDATVTDSTIVNSTIDNSTITNSTITNSTIINSTILDAVVANANISDGVLHSGNVTWGGTNTAGPENLTDIINYAPTAVINASPPSGTSSVTVTFNATLSTDPNIPGDLNDVLNYTWDFTTDGTPDNYSNVTSYTYGVGTHTATLTVTDKFGKSDSATATIAVSSSGGTGGVSGGGGGGGAGVTTTTIQLTEAGVEACLRANDQAAFTFDQVMHTITLTQLGDNYAVLDMPSVEGNLLSGRILLYVNESAKYDLNKNQYYDFYMKLDRIQYGRGCLMMKSIHEPIQPIPAPVPVVGVEEGPEEEPTAPMPRPPRQVTTPKETYTPPVISKPPLLETNLRNIILSVLPIALIAAALLGVVLYKRSSRAVVEEGMSGIEKYVSSALNKGKHIHDIHNDLLEKGWPEESIYAAELKHVILQASKKMSIKDIQNELINKGWPKDMVKAAVLGHFVKEHLTKGKSFEHVKGKLMNAGWKEQEIHQHLKKAK
ncbi:hypothetical protein KY361_03840, partial [Candidatus Woesearchaeota archaeon]|nr:hypothetical protein [Candidatus Woesearchaeota archaeon]